MFKEKDPGKHTCLKNIVCAPLFNAYVKAHALFFEIGLALFMCAFFKGVSALPIDLILLE